MFRRYRKVVSELVSPKMPVEIVTIVNSSGKIISNVSTNPMAPFYLF